MYVLHFGHFFENRKNSGLTPGQNDDPVTRWPGRERWPKWPIDPVTQWPNYMSDGNGWKRGWSITCQLIILLATLCVTVSSIFNVYVILRFRCAQLVCIWHVVFFDTLCVCVFLVFFYKFLVFEAAIYANRDVYNNRRWGGMEEEWEEDR